MILSIILFLLCSFVVIGILITKIKNKKVKKMIIVFGPLLLILGLLSVKIVNGFIPMPIGVRHLLHLVFPPEDLYKPIVKNDFLFYERGFTADLQEQSSGGTSGTGQRIAAFSAVI